MMADADNILFLRGSESDAVMEDTSENDSGCTDEDDLNIITNSYVKVSKISHLTSAQDMASHVSNSKDVLENEDWLSKKPQVPKKAKKIPGEFFKSNDGERCWSVGMFCRATYSEDDQDYEAEIITINPDATCVVEFLGYKNTQTVNLTDLVPSWGRAARRTQLRQSGELNEDTASQRSKGRRTRYMRTPDGVNPGFLPPQPPMPPMFANGGPLADSEQNEALSAMLMSWYMSGYYTGLYHGQCQKKKPRKHN